jgi:hypothetical protein
MDLHTIFRWQGSSDITTSNASLKVKYKAALSCGVIEAMGYFYMEMAVEVRRSSVSFYRRVSG